MDVWVWEGEGGGWTCTCPCSCFIVMPQHALTLPYLTEQPIILDQSPQCAGLQSHVRDCLWGNA